MKISPVHDAFYKWFYAAMLRNREALRMLVSSFHFSEAFNARYPETRIGPQLPGDLKAKFDRHMADEERHEVLYRRWLDTQGGVADLPYRTQYVLRMFQHCDGPNLGRLRQGRLDRRDLVRFFIINALAEANGLKQFSYLLKAAQNAGDDALAEVVQAIVRDEGFHVVYTRQAVGDLAEDDLRDWAIAEMARFEKLEEQLQYDVSTCLMAMFDRVMAPPRGKDRFMWLGLKAAAAAMSLPARSRFPVAPGPLPPLPDMLMA